MGRSGEKAVACLLDSEPLAFAEDTVRAQTPPAPRYAPHTERPIVKLRGASDDKGDLDFWSRDRAVGDRTGFREVR